MLDILGLLLRRSNHFRQWLILITSDLRCSLNFTWFPSVFDVRVLWVSPKLELPEAALYHFVAACVLVIEWMSWAKAQVVALVLCGIAYDGNLGHLVSWKFLRVDGVRVESELLPSECCRLKCARLASWERTLHKQHLVVSDAAPLDIFVHWVVVAPLDHQRFLGTVGLQVGTPWIDNLVVMTQMSSYKLFSLTLSHSSAAQVRVYARWHGRALLQKPIVNLSCRYGHGEQNACLVVIVVVLEVLEHKQSASLSLLGREHVHESFIAQSWKCKAGLSMVLSRFVQLIWLLARRHIPSKLSWYELQLSEILEQIVRDHVRCKPSWLKQVTLVVFLGPWWEQ